jgi:hypothetical protein
MRTVVFFGLMCIADSIGKQTGWSPMPSDVAKFGAVIFIFAVLTDVIDFVFRNCSWRKP